MKQVNISVLWYDQLGFADRDDRTLPSLKVDGVLGPKTAARATQALARAGRRGRDRGDPMGAPARRRVCLTAGAPPLEIGPGASR